MEAAEKSTGLVRNYRKVRTGKVVSAKADKTIVVSVDRTMRHPLYVKIMSRTSKFYAHDEKNDAREGDVVKIMETRPVSKKKCWRLVEIVERAK